MFIVPVQDVAFQLERLVAGMYVYYRQSYRNLKPTAIFPIEVELSILQDSKRSPSVEESPVPPSISPSSSSNKGNQENSTTGHSSPLPSIDSLLLDLGLDDNHMTSSQQ